MSQDRTDRHAVVDNSSTETLNNLLHGMANQYSPRWLVKPSLVFSADADLMFATRQVDIHAATLGALIGQMDGLCPSEEISIVLTTNAIERMEAALKDRPGRISQCIYMGAPGADLREIFLAKQLAPYDLAEVDLDALVEMSRGATQAFLTEWVYRAVQVGCEGLTDPAAPLVLTTPDFEIALAEMRSSQDETANRIVGFQPGQGRS